jgi:ABC-type transport system substrate-binding protein
MQDVLFKVGVMTHSVLDPQIAWDSSSLLIIDQVCEGLFTHNISDPDLKIIPNLALSGAWNPARTEYTCLLRQGVTFHDGALFNADAVIFTWNRLNWALNVTGTNTVQVTVFEELYKLPNGAPIVSSIIKNSDYNITFVLNGPYIPFESLLSFSGSYLLSPSSTPAMAYIDTITGDLVGTGPFVYDNYIEDVEISFHAYDNYWKGKANINDMKYIIENDRTTRNIALLGSEVHFIDGLMGSLIPTYKVSPNITFLETNITSWGLNYLVMNNKKINRTFREAISYAIDYSYINHELKDSSVKRLRSPIPNGILYANDTFEVPTLNLTRARLAMVSMGFGDMGWSNAQWSAATFASWNYSYNIGDDFREDLLILLQYNLDLIGIEVIDQGMSWTDFINRAYGYMEQGGLNTLEFFWLGWDANYNDPSNLINGFFSNSSSSYNPAQYDGYSAAIEAGRNPLNRNDNVQLLMEEALSETDPIAREALYDRIQELLVEEDFPWALVYSPDIYSAFNDHLTGLQLNAMGRIYFYPCKLNYPILPGAVNIYSNADNPDTDGNFDISWSSSTYTDNYSLYRSSSVITTIDGSVNLLLDEVTDFSYETSGYTNGIYYFLVVSKNGNGNTMSENLMVTVELSSENGTPPEIPGFEMWTLFFTFISASLISLLRKKMRTN